jgi:hypothetical protein
VTPPREKSRTERLFSAAVLRRSFELAGPDQQDGFEFVYRGVLRDLGLGDEDVREFLAAHSAEIDAAVGGRRSLA